MPFSHRQALARASLLLIATGCGTPAAKDEAPLRPFITDADGGVVILRGVNVMNSAKSDPNRLASIGPDDADRIAHDWGMNFARLLVFWDAIAPSPGVIDTTYLQQVSQRVDVLAADGIAVMLDMHQDVYSAQFCCDGAPSWAIADDNAPFSLQSTWALNYLQPAVIHAFDNFWGANGAHPELQASYRAAWTAVAHYFAGYPGVLGYDVMNEPFPGSDFNAIEAVDRVTPPDGGTSHTFDVTLLAPMYQTMIDAIRAEDPDGWIFFEPRYGAPGNGSPSYIPALSDPRHGPPRIAYAPHLYSSDVSTTNAYTSNDTTVPDWEAARTRELEAFPVPLLIGEWGTAFSIDGADAYAADILAMADRMRSGWTYWSYDPGPEGSWGLFDPTTLQDNSAVKLLVRPYPRRIAGYPESWSFDPSSLVFDLVFDSRSSAGGTTDLFIPVAQQYPSGWQVTVVGEEPSSWSSRWNATTSVLSLMTDATAPKHHVQVVPAGADAGP